MVRWDWLQPAWTDRMRRMKRRGLKLLLLILLGWYVAGPVVETVDCWDDLRAEICDIAHSAGGLVTLVVAGVSLGMLLFRKWRERCSLLAKAFQGWFESVSLPALLTLAVSVAPVSPSPPPPLRI